MPRPKLNPESDFRTLTIRLESDVLDKLNNLAKATGRSMGFYARVALKKYLEDIEDVYYAEDTLRRVKEGTEKLLDHNEVWNELGV